MGRSLAILVMKRHFMSLFSLHLFALSLFFISMSDTADATQLTLAWDPNTEPDIGGYKLYCGSQSRNYTLSFDVGRQTWCTVSNLVNGRTYYFAVTAYNIHGDESPYSREVVYGVPGSHVMPWIPLLLQ